MKDRKPIILPPLKILSKEVRDAFPEIYDRFNRKIFKNCDRFHDPRFASLSFASVVGILQMRQLDATPVASDNIAKMQAILGKLLLDYDNPTFFVEKSLLAACINTQPPDNLKWKELVFPFPALNFILPRGMLFFSDGSECQFITLARVARGEYQISPLNNINNPTEFCAVFSESANGFSVHQILADAHFVAATEFDPAKHQRPGDAFSLEMNRADHDTAVMLMQIGFNLLFAMAARPELIERGRKSGKHKKSGNEFWQPNIIGRNYRVIRKSGSGTHNSPQLHWRRGHFRYQAYGKNYSKRKEIWIEPMQVCGSA